MCIYIADLVLANVNSKRFFILWDQGCRVANIPAYINNRGAVWIQTFPLPRLQIFHVFFFRLLVTTTSGRELREVLRSNYLDGPPTTSHFQIMQNGTHTRSGTTCIDLHGRRQYPQLWQLDPKQNNLDLKTENRCPHIWPHYILYALYGDTWGVQKELTLSEHQPLMGCDKALGREWCLHPRTQIHFSFSLSHAHKNTQRDIFTIFLVKVWFA